MKIHHPHDIRVFVLIAFVIEDAIVAVRRTLADAHFLLTRGLLVNVFFLDAELGARRMFREMMSRRSGGFGVL